MNEFKVYDISNAPSESRVHLEKIKLKQGSLPNVYGVMAESPVLLQGHAALKELFAKTSLTTQERKIVLLTISRENESPYCISVYSGVAERHKVPADVVEAVRTGAPLKDNKLEALRTFTAKVVVGRGQVEDSDIKSFLDAGCTRANILEIVLAVGMATLTNYTNLIAETSLDAQFEPKVWKKAG